MEAINGHFETLTTLLLTLEKNRQSGFKLMVIEGRVLSPQAEAALKDSYDESLKRQIREVQSDLNRAIGHALERDL